MCVSLSSARAALSRHSAFCGLARLLPLLLLAVAAAHGQEGLPESVQIHGFASQAYIKTDENNFFGESEDGSLEFYELGINGSWAPRPDLQFSLQVVSRDAGAADNGALRVDYGFLDYSFVASATDLWGVRLGRIINPFGFYNDTRDVAFTRPSILLPQSIYFDSARALALSSDGVQFYGERRTDAGDFFLQIGYARPRADDIEFKLAAFRANLPGKLDGALPSMFARILYESIGGAWRFGLSAIKANVDYESRAPFPADLPDGRFSFTPLYFSGQYNSDRWSITGEYALRTTELRDFAPFIDDKFTGESYYLQGSYRFAPKWEGFLRYDVLYWDMDDRGGTKWEAAGRGPYHSAFARDWTVGLRWDVTDNFMLRAEYHNVDGTGWLPISDNPDLINPATWDNVERRWNLFALLASLRF
jgi:hypothetical protein